MLKIFKKKKVNSQTKENINAKEPKKLDAKKSKNKVSKKRGFFGFLKTRKDNKIPQTKPNKKAGYFLGNEYSYLKTSLVREQFIVDLQYKLHSVTRLKKAFLEDFEKIYKVAYFVSNSQRITEWVEFYDLLFIGEGKAIIISKHNTGVGPLLKIKDIMDNELKLDSLGSIFFKIEFLINQMIKMYNEGKNHNYHFRDSINELKYLGLITKDLHARLLFISNIRSKVGRSWCINEVKYKNAYNKTETLHDKQIEFKALLSVVYVDLIEIYMVVQEPYLRKFSLLRSSRKLFIKDPMAFYHM